VTLTIRKIEQEILACGHHVCIVSTKSGNLEYTHLDGEHPNRTVIFLDNAIPIPFLNDPHHPENSYQLGFSLSAAVKRRIADFEPSLVHVTVPDSTCLHLIQYARDREIPLMGTYHSNIPEYMGHYPGCGWLKHVLNAFFRHQYNFLQALYVPTPFIHRFLTDTAKLDRVTDLGVWGRGIDLQRFSPTHRSIKFRRKMGFSDDDVVLCWVGRLVPEKRPDIFCNVVRRLHEQKIPFKALVVGSGPIEDEVQALPNTVFAGWMNGDELSVAYASSDIFLFPSAVETFGNVTLEAAASGLPLVVEQGCSGHLVRHGQNGFACPANDFDAFYESTVCLLLDHQERKRMSEYGRQFSMQFEKRAICKKMLENYTKVTDQFYTSFGGHHANRDQEYQKEHSFLAGNHPRPLVLVFVEFLFMYLFRVMYPLMTMYIHMRQTFFASPSPVPRTEESQLIVSTVSPRLPVEGSPLESIAEVEDFSSSDSSDSTDVEMNAVRMGALMKADDETDSTTSMSDDSSAERKPERYCCRTTTQTEPRPPISHMMAIAFVQIMFLQCRIEGWIRNKLIDFCSPSKWNPMKRKRKNSSFAVDLQRNRSDGSDSGSDDLELLMNARDERLSMRRPSSCVFEAQ
jgi:phosphatidylinositol alpha 1,6-mannosyltransferase